MHFALALNNISAAVQWILSVLCAYLAYIGYQCRHLCDIFKGKAHTYAFHFIFFFLLFFLFSRNKFVEAQYERKKNNQNVSHNFSSTLRLSSLYLHNALDCGLCAGCAVHTCEYSNFWIDQICLWTAMMRLAKPPTICSFFIFYYIFFSCPLEICLRNLIMEKKRRVCALCMSVC